MKELESRLHREDAHQQQSRAVDARHQPALAFQHRRVHDASGQIRKSEAQQARREQRHHGGGETRAVGPEIAEQLQRLAEGFPVQLRLRQVDARLVVP